ncbi:hypothetical protein EV426DRAFT_707169 [Tirmania nivea]|nr:hypothetical protein EV426DRAFT_707169 [Tirmania nivea]
MSTCPESPRVSDGGSTQVRPNTASNGRTQADASIPSVKPTRLQQSKVSDGGPTQVKPASGAITRSLTRASLSSNASTRPQQLRVSTGGTIQMRPAPMLKIRRQTRAPVAPENWTDSQHFKARDGGSIAAGAAVGAENSRIGNSNTQQTSAEIGASPDDLPILGTKLNITDQRTVRSNSQKTPSFQKTQGRAKKTAMATPTQKALAKILLGKSLGPVLMGRKVITPILDADENRPPMGLGSTTSTRQVELKMRELGEQQYERSKETMDGSLGEQEQNQSQPRAIGLGLLQYNSITGLRGVTVQAQDDNSGAQARGPWTAVPNPLRQPSYNSTPPAIEPIVLMRLPSQKITGDAYAPPTTPSSLFFPNKAEHLNVLPGPVEDIWLPDTLQVSATPEPSPNLVTKKKTLKHYQAETELGPKEMQDTGASVMSVMKAKFTSLKPLRKNSMELLPSPSARWMSRGVDLPNCDASDTLSSEAIPIRQLTEVGTPDCTPDTKSASGEVSYAPALPAVPVEIHIDFSDSLAGSAASTTNPVLVPWNPPTFASMCSRLSHGPFPPVKPVQRNKNEAPSSFSSMSPAPITSGLQGLDPDAMDLDVSKPEVTLQLIGESISSSKPNFTTCFPTLTALHQHSNKTPSSSVDSVNMVAPSEGATTSKEGNPAVFYKNAMSTYFKAQAYDPSLDAFFPHAPRGTVDSATLSPLSLATFTIKFSMKRDKDLLTTALYLTKIAWLGLDYGSSTANLNSPLMEFMGSLLSASWDMLLGQLGLRGAPDQMEARVLLMNHLASHVRLYTAEGFKVKLEERLAASFASVERKEMLAAMISSVNGWGIGWWWKVHAILAEDLQQENEKPLSIHVLWTEEVLLSTLRLAWLARQVGWGLEDVWRLVMKRTRSTEVVEGMIRIVLHKGDILADAAKNIGR